MSIYIHITRKPNPCWRGGEQIPESEWRGVALAEPDFRVPTEAELKHDPWLLASDIFWTGHPKHPLIPFSWCNGQIELKYLDAVTTAKMVSLATRLRAEVISEEGEVFDSEGHSTGIRDLPDERPN